MGFLDKLAFWKKDDLGSFDKGLDIGKNDFGSMDLGGPNNDFNANNIGMPTPSQGMPDMTNFRGVGDTNGQNEMNRTIQQQLGPDPMADSSPSFSTYSPKSNFQEVPRQNATNSHEIEVISAKLDAIRATLDAVNQRLSNLERAAYPEQNNNPRRAGW